MTSRKSIGTKDGQDRALNFSYAVLTILMLLTLGSALIFYKSAVANDEIRFSNEVGRVKVAIQNRIELYNSLLTGGRGLLESASNEKRTRFSAYVESLGLSKNYPGVRRVGAIRSVNAADLPATIAEMRADGLPEFNVTPAAEKETYDVLVYSEPSDEDSLRAIGYDLSSNEERRSVLEQARDSGHAVASGSLNPLIELKDSPVSSVVVIFLPIYRGGKVPESIELRRQQISGFVYVSFVPAIFLQEIIKSLPERNFGVKIYDQSAQDQNLLAESVGDPGDVTKTAIGPGRVFDRFDIADRIWIAQYDPLPSFEAGSYVRWTPIIVIVGLCLSFMLFAMTYREATARVRLQRTAEELLKAAA